VRPNQVDFGTSRGKHASRFRVSNAGLRRVFSEPDFLNKFTEMTGLPRRKVREIFAGATFGAASARRILVVLESVGLTAAELVKQ
jgi:hypothetical protein